MTDNKKLDMTDTAILQILWNDARISMTELGKRVHLTGQAVKNRLDRLADLGVLQRYTVRLNCPAYGYPMHALISLQMDVLVNAQNKFEDFIWKGKYRVIHCYQTTGKRAYFIDSFFRDNDELRTFLSELSVYGSYEVQMVLKDIQPSDVEVES